MIDQRLRFHCEFSLYRDGYALHIGRGDPLTAVAQPLIFVPHERGMPSEPTLEMKEDAAQALIDALWQAGLRPTQGKQSEGMFAAQSRHLADMRALAFAKLGVAPPGESLKA